MEKKTCTLNELFDLYLSLKPELKEQTRVHYRYMWNRYVAGSIGRRDVTGIFYSDVKKYYLQLRGEGLSQGTVSVIHSMLHPVFLLGVRDLYITVNPADYVLAEVGKVRKDRIGPRHALTLPEQTAFIRFLGTSNVYARYLPLFTVFLGTGCRVGELTGLCWHDCDFENAVISINRSLIYKPVGEDRTAAKRITSTKTRAGCREIPMFDEVAEALRAERRAQAERGGCKESVDGFRDFVFTNSRGKTYTPCALNDVINRIVSSCNRKELRLAAREGRAPCLIRHFSVHNLRHTFCTRLCEVETNVKVIQAIMGHADISTTMNIYAEATAEKKKQTVRHLQGKIHIVS